MKKFVIAYLLWTASLYAQNVPEKFRFTTDYYFLDLKGHVGHREQIVGMYTRDLSAKKVKWTDVRVARSEDSSDKFGPRNKRDFMEGFSYALGASDTTDPGFFRKLPPNQIQEQNLVWDSRMFEIFGEDHFDDLKPNVPYHVPGPANIPLAGAGTFQNKDVQLIWSGTSKCDRQDCAVIDYQAFFNTFELQMPKETLTGRSHYWGQIWVSFQTKRIVRATLYEDVLGEVTAPGLARPQPVNIFRTGLFEPVKE